MTFQSFHIYNQVCTLNQVSPLLEVLANTMAVIIEQYMCIKSIHCTLYQINTLYTLYLHSVICQLYFNIAEKKITWVYLFLHVFISL